MITIFIFFYYQTRNIDKTSNWYISDYSEYGDQIKGIDGNYPINIILISFIDNFNPNLAENSKNLRLRSVETVIYSLRHWILSAEQLNAYISVTAKQFLCTLKIFLSVNIHNIYFVRKKWDKTCFA